jgi:hypothetical protein
MQSLSSKKYVISKSLGSMNYCKAKLLHMEVPKFKFDKTFFSNNTPHALGVNHPL